MAKLSKDKVEKIMELIDGGMSERKACEEAGVHRSTFRSSVLRHKMDEQYARALESLAHRQIESMEQTIDDMREKRISWKEAQVELDARKWFASKFLPRQYSERLEIDETSTVTHKFEDLTDEQLEAEIKKRQDRIA